MPRASNASAASVLALELIQHPEVVHGGQGVAVPRAHLDFEIRGVERFGLLIPGEVAVDDSQVLPHRDDLIVVVPEGEPPLRQNLLKGSLSFVILPLETVDVPQRSHRPQRVRVRPPERQNPQP